MEFALDACSIILLANATVLEAFSKWHEPIISKTVYKEVLEGKNKKFLDALLTERLCLEKKIKIVNVKDKNIIAKLEKDFGLGLGEAETIALVLENKCNGVITDNKQGRKTTKVYGLPLLGSLEVIVGLFKAKRINKDKAIAALNLLRKFGWFKDYLINQILEEVKNE